jgi:15-cis-phytoene desaturase
MDDVLILGGGLAGLSCAADLVDEDVNVRVLEANEYLGGRASNTVDPVEEDPVPIAPHIYVSFYDELQDFFQKIGAEDAIYWEDGRICDLYYKGELQRVTTGHLQPPWYLASLFTRYPFFTIREKLNNYRVGFKIYMLDEEEVKELDDTTTLEFLQDLGAKEGVINKFYRLLCLTLLNAPIERCSAAEFCILMRNFMRTDATNWGYPRGGLGDVYTGYAKEYIHNNGGSVDHPKRVDEIVFEDGKVDHVVTEDGEEIEADVVISALPPTQLREIMPEEQLETEFFSHLKAFHGVSYYATFAWFDGKVTGRRFWALLDAGRDKYWNSDFYDKSNIPGIDEENSYITANIININEMEDKTQEELKEKTMEELREVFGELDAELEHFSTHEIDYALYEPVTGMRQHKLPHRTPVDNLYLAGDWTIKEIPQCMEAAVRSGRRTASTVLERTS